MSSSERTPLIQTVVVTNRTPRYPHSTFRRFCTLALGSTLIFALIFVFIPVAILFPSHDSSHHHNDNDHHPHEPSSGDGDGSTWSDYLPWSRALPNPSWPSTHGLNSFHEVKKILLSTPEETKAREWSQYYASGPHLAGKNLSEALWTRDRWREFGVKEVEIVSYDCYLNYHLDHRLALLDVKKGKNTEEGHDYKVKYECELEEDVLEEDPTTGLADRIPTFHGYSASGNVTASYVFVNFGTYQDFEDLRDAGIKLEGKIALAKYGRIFRGLKVKRAQELGMVGVVMYSDLDEDGEITEQNGYKAYPDGPARNPSSVQRGSVQYLSFLPGDPTTPGYPSKPGVPRADPHHSVPSIPSLPISYRDAIPLLTALNGQGPNATSFNEAWQGGGLRYKGVQYSIGPSPDSLVLNLVNLQEYVTTPLWNVIGVINGTIPDEVVILGNHRDAWIAGGAGDPNSGSAALNEVIRSVGKAMKAGWKPLRTIVFASWDGEEYGLVGSTEWVEEFIPWLSGSTIAYLNVDVGARGTNFNPAAAPLLNGLIRNVTASVQSPNQTVKGQTVFDVWDRDIRTMGSGSDFTAFQDFAGIPSADYGFGAGIKNPVYHYHSNYDSFAWMDNYGDKDWHYHVTMAKLLALSVATLSDSPILPLNATDYAQALQKYMQNVKHQAQQQQVNGTTTTTTTVPSKPYLNFDFTHLDTALTSFLATATTFDAHALSLTTTLSDRNSLPPWWQFWKRIALYRAARDVNTRLKLLERQFLYAKGLDHRSWFKHVVFAPGRWTGYSGATFPGLVEGFEDEDLEGVRRWAGIVVERLRAAEGVLDLGRKLDR